MWLLCTLYMGAISCFTSINIRILMLTPTGHYLETGCYDWYRGSDFEPMGSFCEKVWLYSIVWKWEHKVCINLSCNHFELQSYLPKCKIVSLMFLLVLKLIWFDFYMKCNYCRIQPVYVVDVAAALTTVLKDDGTSMGKTYELGGPEIFTVHDLVTCYSSSLFVVILYFIFGLNMILVLQNWLICFLSPPN